ncbi:MAG: DUF4810 domain-containing protein [Proteobacteria bacterium]|nr:DUF4810 domain-containing protein [Pseudomonadota bacterium]
MKNKLIKQRVLPFALLASVLLAGCSTPPKTLYQWEGYQPQVYEYLKGQGPEAQIGILEADLQKIHAKGNRPPPGYHAHLGLLYSSIGKLDLVEKEFQTEKELFPESATYMDFLLKKTKL